MNIIDEISGLYQIVELPKLRETPGVIFDMIPHELLDGLSGIDRVIHEKHAISPGPIGSIERPWYMHTTQRDNLVVLRGERHVDLYTIEHGKVESFVVTPTKVYHNGVLISDVPAILTWPTGVFHRVMSMDEGSASFNLAQRTSDFDINTNFSIYDLNTDTGEFQIIRDGYKDQFKF